MDKEYDAYFNGIQRSIHLMDKEIELKKKYLLFVLCILIHKFTWNILIFLGSLKSKFWKKINVWESSIKINKNIWQRSFTQTDRQQHFSSNSTKVPVDLALVNGS